MISRQILDLPTPRLLAYYKKYYRGNNLYLGYDGIILDQEAYDEFVADRDAIKAELETREHVQRKK